MQVEITVLREIFRTSVLYAKIKLQNSNVQNLVSTMISQETVTIGTMLVIML